MDPTKDDEPQNTKQPVKRLLGNPSQQIRERKCSWAKYGYVFLIGPLSHPKHLLLLRKYVIVLGNKMRFTSSFRILAIEQYIKIIFRSHGD